ncbi:hypothetical protein S2091_1823 [Solimicrobium silvestre]|uniref:Uncharacterized protein n=1 Tax=Solimicrobium silvestre TaxID=2099400 RepID=A0A2S9H0P6_9BURK|nr:hypothetical protein S2091_1823 [Solimicrobium silvestre]
MSTSELKFEFFKKMKIARYYDCLWRPCFVPITFIFTLLYKYLFWNMPSIQLVVLFMIIYFVVGVILSIKLNATVECPNCGYAVFSKKTLLRPKQCVNCGFSFSRA